MEPFISIKDFNKFQPWTARQAQLIQEVQEGTEISLFELTLIYQRVTYFVHQINLKNCSSKKLRQYLRLVMEQCVFYGRVGITIINDRPYCFEISEYTMEKISGTEINLYQLTDFQPEEISVPREQAFIFQFNAQNFGIWVKALQYIPKIDELLDLLMNQVQWLNLKMGIKVTDKAKYENLISQKNQDGKPLWKPINFKDSYIIMEDCVDYHALDLPEVKIKEYFELIQDYLSFFDDIIGIKVANAFSDKTRDLQAQQNTQTYKSNVIFNEWFENVELFVEWVNENFNEQIEAEELVEFDTPVKSAEHQAQDGINALNSGE